MSAHRFAPRAALLLAVFALGACKVKEAGTDSALDSDSSKAASSASSDVAAAPAANVVTITAKDYSFDAPAEIPAGLTTIRLVTEGKELHHASLIKLDEGKTIDDFKQAMANDNFRQALASDQFRSALANDAMKAASQSR